MKVIASYHKKITFAIMIGNDGDHLVDTPSVVCFDKLAIFSVLWLFKVAGSPFSAARANSLKVAAGGHIPPDSAERELSNDPKHVVKG